MQHLCRGIPGSFPQDPGTVERSAYNVGASQRPDQTFQYPVVLFLTISFPLGVTSQFLTAQFKPDVSEDVSLATSDASAVFQLNHLEGFLSSFAP